MFSKACHSQLQFSFQERGATKPMVMSVCRYARSTVQTGHPDAGLHLSMEEESAAEGSFTVYCKPVEFYNILQRRASRNPLFLQRCLDYKIKARQKKRIQMTALLSDDETQAVFPLYICLAKLAPYDEDAEKYSAVYRISRIFIFRDPSEIDGETQHEAKFMLPEVHKIAAVAKAGSVVLLFFTTVEDPSSSSGVNENLMPLDPSSYESRDGEYCLCGKVPLDKIFQLLDKSPNLRLGLRAETTSTVDLHPCFLKYGVLDKEQSISIQAPNNFQNGFPYSTSKQLQFKMYAEECGAREKSPFYTNTRAVASPSFSRVLRLKEGNVKFNYRYCNNKLKRTEVTEDFSCPLCLVKCASYKGLKYHLVSSHDLFNFEFSAWEDCPSVNVSVKADASKSEIVADHVDPKIETFIFCAKPLKRIKPEDESSEKAKDADPLTLESEIPTGDAELLEKADGVSNAIIQSHPVPDPDRVPPIAENDLGGPAVLKDVSRTTMGVNAINQSHPAPDRVPPTAENNLGSPAVLQDVSRSTMGVSNAIIQPHPDPDCVPPIAAENDLGSPAVLQDATAEKSPVPKHDPRIVTLLSKKQYYHSHKGQPMALEEVLSDQDSETEVDHEVADIEDRMMLSHFIDVTDDEKRFMHMWNAFIRRQRVLADGHVPWVCEAFIKVHGHELVQSPELTWFWRLYTIKLWNHGLLDAKTINTCSIILEQYQKLKSDPKS